MRSQESIDDASVRSLAPDAETQRNEQQIADHKKQLQALRRAVKDLDARILSELTGVDRDDWKTETMRLDIARRQIGKSISQDEFDRYAELIRKRDELARVRPAELEKALCVKEHGRECPATHVLVRGNAHAAGAGRTRIPDGTLATGARGFSAGGRPAIDRSPPRWPAGSPAPKIR